MRRLNFPMDQKLSLTTDAAVLYDSFHHNFHLLFHP
jgi:hypothetical protein